MKMALLMWHWACNQGEPVEELRDDIEDASQGPKEVRPQPLFGPCDRAYRHPNACSVHAACFVLLHAYQLKDLVTRPAMHASQEVGASASREPALPERAAAAKPDQAGPSGASPSKVPASQGADPIEDSEGGAAPPNPIAPGV